MSKAEREKIKRETLEEVAERFDLYKSGIAFSSTDKRDGYREAVRDFDRVLDDMKANKSVKDAIADWERDG